MRSLLSVAFLFVASTADASAVRYTFDGTIDGLDSSLTFTVPLDAADDDPGINSARFEIDAADLSAVIDGTLFTGDPTRSHLISFEDEPGQADEQAFFQATITDGGSTSYSFQSIFTFDSSFVFTEVREAPPVFDEVAATPVVSFLDTFGPTSASAAVVPEPSTLLMSAVTVCGLAAFRRKRQAQTH